MELAKKKEYLINMFYVYKITHYRAQCLIGSSTITMAWSYVKILLSLNNEVDISYGPSVAKYF